MERLPNYIIAAQKVVDRNESRLAEARLRHLILAAKIQKMYE